MYNNNSFNFQYDMVAVILDSNGNPLRKIGIREYEDWMQDASFAESVANTGVHYAVATNEVIDIGKISPYNTQIVIDEQEYKVIQVARVRAKLGGIGAKKYETVFYLS